MSALPRAPRMTVYSLYGVGMDTERAYVYELNPDYLLNGTCSNRPFRIDTRAHDKARGLHHGVYFTDGDGSVPTVSNGFMCARGWRDYPHLNPAGVRAVCIEYAHQSASLGNKFASLLGLGADGSDPDPRKSSSSLFTRTGPKTGHHVDILGNHEMIMHIARIAGKARAPVDAAADAGANTSGADGGGGGGGGGEGSAGADAVDDVLRNGRIVSDIERIARRVRL